MKAPDKIYVKEFDEGISQIWSSIKATETTAHVQHEYIRKEALLEWAKEKYEEYNRRLVGFPDDGAYWGQRNAFRQIIDKLNSI